MFALNIIYNCLYKVFNQYGWWLFYPVNDDITITGSIVVQIDIVNNNNAPTHVNTLMGRVENNALAANINGVNLLVRKVVTSPLQG